MKSKIVLIIGAKSDIAISTAEVFARSGYIIKMAGRNINEFKALHPKLVHYHTQIEWIEFDILQTEKFKSFISSFSELPEIIISFVGYMGVKDESEKMKTSLEIMKTNYVCPSLLFKEFANAFEVRGSGCLVGVSSVAGIRGRWSNYIYGSAKGGFTLFLSGLRARLYNKGIHVLTILPGFVNTQATKDMNLPKFLTAQPLDVANEIFKSVGLKKDVVYVYKIWKLIMLFIILIPEKIFKRMKF